MSAADIEPPPAPQCSEAAAPDTVGRRSTRKRAPPKADWQRRRVRSHPDFGSSKSALGRTRDALGAVFRGRVLTVAINEETKYVHLWPLMAYASVCPRYRRDIRHDAGLVVALSMAHHLVPPPTALFVPAQDVADVLVHEAVAEGMVSIGWYAHGASVLARATITSAHRCEAKPLYRKHVKGSAPVKRAVAAPPTIPSQRAVVVPCPVATAATVIASSLVEEAKKAQPDAAPVATAAPAWTPPPSPPPRLELAFDDEWSRPSATTTGPGDDDEDDDEDDDDDDDEWSPCRSGGVYVQRVPDARPGTDSPSRFLV